MTNFNWLKLDTNQLYATLKEGKIWTYKLKSKISLLVALIQWCVTESNLSLIFTKTLLFAHSRAYLCNNSHNAYKKADGNSKLNITKLNPWKLTFQGFKLVVTTQLFPSLLLFPSSLKAFCRHLKSKKP